MQVRNFEIARKQLRKEAQAFDMAMVGIEKKLIGVARDADKILKLADVEPWSPTEEEVLSEAREMIDEVYLEAARVLYEVPYRDWDMELFAESFDQAVADEIIRVVMDYVKTELHSDEPDDTSWAIELLDWLIPDEHT